MIQHGSFTLSGGDDPERVRIRDGVVATMLDSLSPWPRVHPRR
jgi:hypothetical protein